MQHAHHRVPVTALAFLNQDVLLSGEGSLLKAYDTEQRTLLTAIEVFPNQAVHGIIVENKSIVTWGGQFICQLAVRYDPKDSLILDAGPVFEAEDWILDASFSPFSSEGSRRVALLTAHNALSLTVLSNSLHIRLEPRIPGSNCILYAAHVTWLSASTCLIASGTAFGDVIVWSCSVEQREGGLASAHQVHYNFSAHEGSVFGVSLSSPSIAGALGGRKHVLASCSDDRTIRLWDVSDLDLVYATPEEQRQTGFGPQLESDSLAPACLGKAMGHISRIWRLCFIQGQPREGNAASEPVRVISFGEDACCITWEVELSGHDCPTTYTMKQMEVQKAHTGKNIWSIATERSHQIATGAADGSVALRTLEDLEGHGQPTEIIQNAEDKSPADSFRTYAFTCPSTLVATTNFGSLMLLSLDANGSVSSKQVASPIKGLHGYSIMASVPTIAFSAGSQGCVYAYMHESDKVEKVIETGHKVAGLFSQSPQSSGTTFGSLHLLITNVSSLSASLCKITPASTLSTSGDNIQVETCTLTLPPGFVVTSFAHALHAGQKLVALGSRSGAIAVYSVPDLCEASLTHAILHSAIHGKEAVTSLLFLRNDETSPGSILLLSTGRDGTYAGHRLELVSGYLQMKTIHQLSLPFGPNVEGVGYSLEGSIWIWGFRSKQFVVWNVDTQQEVMKVECGGANRNWAFQLGENGGTFVWTKASKVYHQSHTRLPFQSINAGGHGREIKSLAIAPTEMQLIATGAEDTDIKLSTYKEGLIRCLHTLQRHNTGIQHLQWSTDGRFLFSSGGFEEFYIWKINYDMPSLRIGVLCESAHPNSGTSDLRIMHFDMQCIGDQNFDIAMVYSDSSVRMWRYVSKTWSLLATGSYLTSCLTQCLLPANSETSLITGSTDGHLGTWKFALERECVEWVSRHQVHQSAILSLVSHDLVDDTGLIITGGDDNGLGITRMQETGGETRTLLVPRAHAAAVTALAIVGREENRLRIVSASIDQRIKLWQIDIDFEKQGVDGIDIKLLQSRHTAVADVSSIESIRLSTGEGGILVCGVGMDFWKIEE